MIWEYKDSDPDSDQLIEQIKKTEKDIFEPYVFEKCQFCKTEMNLLSSKSERGQTNAEATHGYHVFHGHGEDLPEIYQEDWNRSSSDTQIAVFVCNKCGWWNVMRKETSAVGVNPQDIQIEEKYYIAWAALKKLNLSNIEIPIEELKTYLLAKYEDRFLIHPKVFEDIVGSIFKNSGYHVRVIGRSGDGGIDVVIFDGEKNDVIGVQVKRYRGKIGVEQIRAFEGALIAEDFPKGIFVTTSSFTKGSVKTASNYQILKRGVPIELYDAKKLYDYLELTKRDAYKYRNDSSAPFYNFVRNPESIPFIYSAFSIF